jgi:hypothetical protein
MLIYIVDVFSLQTMSMSLSGVISIYENIYLMVFYLVTKEVAWWGLEFVDAAHFVMIYRVSAQLYDGLLGVYLVAKDSEVIMTTIVIFRYIYWFFIEFCPLFSEIGT